MVNADNSLKEANELATMICANLNVLRDLHNTTSIPNIASFNGEAAQFNMRCGSHCHNFSMFFNVYYCGDNNYLLDLVSMFPQDNFYYPEGSDESTAQFVIQGAPFLGAHKLEKPMGAYNLEAAIDTALEYVIENIPSIVGEAMGLSGL